MCVCVLVRRRTDEGLLVVEVVNSVVLEVMVAAATTINRELINKRSNQRK